MDTKKRKATGWKNRIVGNGEVDPESLLANPLNWRIHPKQQQDALETVLDEVGWVDDIIVNQRTGFVVDGHLRVSLALRRHEKTIPVKLVDLSEYEERLILLTLDPIGALAVSEHEKMQELLDAMPDENEQVNTMLKGMLEADNLQASLHPKGKGNLDTSKLQGAVVGTDGTNYVVYIACLDRQRFEQVVELLTDGQRKPPDDPLVHACLLKADEFIGLWERLNGEG